MDRLLFEVSDFDDQWVRSADAWKLSFAISAISITFSLIHILRHLRSYTMPAIQSYVIRILCICPVYALSSAVAVFLGRQGIYAEIVRDIYEAFVIYSFFNLILEYSGGETDMIYQIENEPPLRLPFPMCFLKPMPRDARLMRLCFRGVLQFIIIKPVMAVFDLTMLACGLYYHSTYQGIQLFIYNMSYGCALYCLYVFYLAIKKIIKSFRPISKFATVKVIIFATYYQKLLDQEDAILWNDLLLCIEMVIFALALMLAFPVSEFIGGIPNRRVLQNVTDAFRVRDLYNDVYHNFSPAYRDYAVQKSQTEAPNSQRLRTYFGSNLDSVAQEMTERYRGRSRRMAFNSLLRGVKPAKLRQHTWNSSEMYHQQGQTWTAQHNCEFNSDISNNASSNAVDDTKVVVECHDMMESSGQADPYRVNILLVAKEKKKKNDKKVVFKRSKHDEKSTVFSHLLEPQHHNPNDSLCENPLSTGSNHENSINCSESSSFKESGSSGSLNHNPPAKFRVTVKSLTSNKVAGRSQNTSLNRSESELVVTDNEGLSHANTYTNECGVDENGNRQFQQSTTFINRFASFRFPVISPPNTSSQSSSQNSSRLQQQHLRKQVEGDDLSNACQNVVINQTNQPADFQDICLSDAEDDSNGLENPDWGEFESAESDNLVETSYSVKDALPPISTSSSQMFSPIGSISETGFNEIDANNGNDDNNHNDDSRNSYKNHLRHLKYSDYNFVNHAPDDEEFKCEDDEDEESNASVSSSSPTALLAPVHMDYDDANV